MNMRFWSRTWQRATAMLCTVVFLTATYVTPVSLAKNPASGGAGARNFQINFQKLAQGKLEVRLANGKILQHNVKGWDPQNGARYNELAQKMNMLVADANSTAGNCNKELFNSAMSKLQSLANDIQKEIEVDQKLEQKLWDNQRKIQDAVKDAKRRFGEEKLESMMGSVLKKGLFWGSTLALSASGFGIAAVVVRTAGIINGAYNKAQGAMQAGETENAEIRDLKNRIIKQHEEILKQATRSLLWNNLNQALKRRMSQLQGRLKDCDKDKTPSETAIGESLDSWWLEGAKETPLDDQTGQPLQDYTITVIPQNDTITALPNPDGGGVPFDNFGGIPEGFIGGIPGDGSVTPQGDLACGPCDQFRGDSFVYDPVGNIGANKPPTWSAPIDATTFGANAIFADGFESGDTSAWTDSNPTRLSSNTANNTGNAAAGGAGTGANGAANTPSQEYHGLNGLGAFGNTNQLWGDWFLVDPANAFGDNLVHIEAGSEGAANPTGYTFYGRYTGTDAAQKPCPKPRGPLVLNPGDLVIGGLPVNTGDTVIVKAPCHKKSSTTKGKTPTPTGKTTLPNKKIRVFVPTPGSKQAAIDKVVKDLETKGIKVTDKSKVKYKPLVKGNPNGPGTVYIDGDNYTKTGTKKAEAKPKTTPKPKPKKKKKPKQKKAQEILTEDTSKGKDKDIKDAIDRLKKKLGLDDKDVFPGKTKYKKIGKMIIISIYYLDWSKVPVADRPEHAKPKTKPKDKDKKADGDKKKRPTTGSTPKTGDKTKEATGGETPAKPCPKITNDSNCCVDPQEDSGLEYETSISVLQFKESVMVDPLFKSKGSWGQSYDDQWALKRIGFEDAASWPETGKEVIVAVIDSGVDTTHPDMRGSLWTNDQEIPDNGIDDDENGYVDDYYGWNFVDETSDITDNNGHGTLVSGIIGAWSNNGTGIAGVNPWARIMPVKVIDFDGKGGSIGLAEGIIYAVENGARVINASVGGDGISKAEQFAIDYANDNGVVVVVASGNDGESTENFSPAGLPGVITVSSTELSDKRVNFSNWGTSIDLTAPGVDVLSLRARNTDFLIFEKEDYEPGKAFVGRDYRYYRTAGTSFSAPFVAGVASLILSTNPQLSNEQVKRMLLYSARDIDLPGKDLYTGYGLLDAQAALKADPEFFLDAEIEGVTIVQGADGYQIEVNGTAMANDFKQAWIEVGAGENPNRWQRVQGTIGQPVEDGVLLHIPVGDLSSSPQWIIRLVTEHANGQTRENRYSLSLQ